MNKTAFLAAFLLAAAGFAHAQVSVDQAWVRTTVVQQQSTAVYLTITSVQGGKLVEASSPLAATAQVHEMKMDGDMMRMRGVDTLALPAGKPVEFKPNGYHLMLTGLKSQVKAGDMVPIKLVIEDTAGKRQVVEVRALAKTGM